MKIIYLGDIVGRSGREITKIFLDKILEENDIDLVLANGENAAGGNGLTEKVAYELFSYGIDGLSMGNHIWDKRDIFKLLDNDIRVVRPANYPKGTPGNEYTILRTKYNKYIALVNLMGRVFLSNLECPFRKMDEILPKIKEKTNCIIVDFHAEATSEKIALGWHLDGKVSAVFGTHTHVQTNDCRILPKGTGYITDLGMTGSQDSVLGVRKDIVIKKFMTQMPVKFELSSSNPQVCGVIFDISENGITNNIQNFSFNSEDLNKRIIFSC